MTFTQAHPSRSSSSLAAPGRTASGCAARLSPRQGPGPKAPRLRGVLHSENPPGPSKDQDILAEVGSFLGPRPENVNLDSQTANFKMGVFAKWVVNSNCLLGSCGSSVGSIRIELPTAKGKMRVPFSVCQIEGARVVSRGTADTN